MSPPLENRRHIPEEPGYQIFAIDPQWIISIALLAKDGIYVLDVYACARLSSSKEL